LLTLSWAAVPASRRNTQAVEVSRIQIRGLNLWANDAGRIQSGRLIGVPLATTMGADARQQATQSNSALPTEGEQ
jgi:hypothetical protein